MQAENNMLLDQQLCFPLYAASRLVTKQYNTLLKQYKLTYPQYLVLLVLWENNGLTISQIGKRLLLESNTLSPLLKTMVKNGFIVKLRDKHDERTVIISLTKKSEALYPTIKQVISSLNQALICDSFSIQDSEQLKDLLNRFIALSVLPKEK